MSPSPCVDFSGSKAVHELNWLLGDHQGTPTVIADGDGSNIPQVKSTTIRSAFGKPISQTGAVDSAFGFQGQVENETTGEGVFCNRNYSSQQGRFTSQEPIRFASGQTNHYQFVGNRPHMGTDPSGLFEFNSSVYVGADLGLMQSLSEQELLNYAIVDIRDPSVLDQLYRDGLLNEGLHVEASLMLARHHHVQIGLSDTPISSARFTSIKRRVGGGIKAAVGTLEIGAASLMMLAPAPGARIVAGVVGANGAMNVKAGWQTATTGVVHRTDFSKSVTRLAVSSGIDAYSAQRLGDYGQFSLDVGTGVAMSTVRVVNAPQTVYNALGDGGVERILGVAPSRGAMTGGIHRIGPGQFADLDHSGGALRSLSTGRIKVTTNGIDVVEGHLSRFRNGQGRLWDHNQAMLSDLRKIARGEKQATQVHLDFYAHELREFTRLRRLGSTSGPVNPNHYINAHYSTLREYGIPFENHGNYLYTDFARSFLGL